MALFQKIADSFSVNKSTRADEDRDQVIRETKKRTRLINDGEWIKNKPSDDSQHLATDVNYGKSALNRVKSSEGLNSDSSKTTGLKSTTKADTIDGRKSSTWVINAGRKVVLNRYRSEEFLDRDTSSTTDLSKTQRASTLDKPTRYRTVLFVSSSEPSHKLDKKVVLSRHRSEEVLNSDKGSTNISSPTNKYSSLERKTRTSSYKTEELPKMTIITSETKTESPISKSQQSRPSPDGQVTTQEKSPTKPILKWGSQKEETSRSSYVPKSSTLEQNTSKTPTSAESDSLIDLTPTTESTNKGSDFISKVGSKSLIDLSITPEQTNTNPVTTPTAPARTSSLIDLSPSSPAKSKRNSGNWDESSSYTTTSTKSTFNPRNSSGDWNEVTSYTTTSTKTTFNPRNSSSEDWDNTNSHTTTSTKTTFPSPRSTSEHDLPKDEPSTYKSSTSYTKSSRTFSSNSLNDKSPVVEPGRYDSRSSYKENSPPSEHLSEDGDSYRSPSYSKIRNSSSSLSDGKSPAKVISLTTAFTSAEQRSSDKNKCSQCYKPIEHGAKMILEELNINCHAACFKCQICHTSLENLSAGDNFWVHQRVVHCENCYDQVKAQRSY
ncbi:sciellin isoform X3 [Stegostoma tigrinum]|uniref:sciellin isoform X3 n=1 Tax=Stegostoma tigrinum TaxID=3053191 RepID=UPI00202B7F24|nr:sciellin isoform X3 [Stegostoma tigrinum]